MKMRIPTTPSGMLSPSVRPGFVEPEEGSVLLSEEVEFVLMLSWPLGVDVGVAWRVEVESVEAFEDVKLELILEDEVRPLWQP